MKKIILFVIVTTSSLIVFGYTKKNHTIITKCAIDLLNHFQKDFITAAEAAAIIKGNISEDKNLFKGAIRCWNQHFYNPLKPKELWRRSKSIDVRFERIAKRWRDRIRSRKYFHSIGEIVHHIQDITNPAHAVPVYHVGGDKFDEQDCSAYLPKSIMIDTGAAYSSPYLRSILERVAIETLASIHDQFEIKVNGTSKTIDRSYFWQDNPQDWFGGYGLLGNNYLHEKIVLSDTVYLIDKSIYKNYSSKQIKLAVIQTANFIFFAKKQLQKP